MSDFTIFIAGSTNLDINTNSDIKKTIKKSIEDTYCKNNVTLNGYTIVCKDCSNSEMDSKQAEYNQTITNEASLFLLVIDKLPVGVYSMEEVMRACICFEANKKRPDVYLYVSSKIQNEDQIKDLGNVILSFTGRYTTFFDDEEDCIRKLKKALNESTKRKQKEDEEALRGEKENDKKMKKDRLFRFLKHSGLAILIVSVLLLTLSLCRKDKPIFFVGGGTVKQFLSDHNMDIDDRQDGIYIHIPTDDSWVMLGDEYKVGEKSKKKYYPVIMAADSIGRNLDKLGINDFSKYRNGIGHIAELYLGKDSLFVYISDEEDSNKNPLLRFISKDDEITAHELYNILHHFKGKDSIIVYHTSSGSGTVAAYCGAMIESDPIAESEVWCWEMGEKLKGHEQFDRDNTLLSHVIETPFISLGSKSYHIKDIDEPNKGAKKLLFVNNQGQPLEKPLFLYFVMRRVDGEDAFKIEKPIKRFLKELVKKGNVEELKDMRIKNVYETNSKELIVPFNEISK